MAGRGLVEALHLYPIVFLNATAAFANIDPALEEAAQSCSAGRWARFRRILLPCCVRAVRGMHHRLHLELHRTGHSPDVRHAGSDQRADF